MPIDIGQCYRNVPLPLGLSSVVFVLVLEIAFNVTRRRVYILGNGFIAKNTRTHSETVYIA